MDISLASVARVGITTGQEKLSHAKDKPGFDAVVDHKEQDCAEQLAKGSLNGTDVYGVTTRK